LVSGSNAGSAGVACNLRGKNRSMAKISQRFWAFLVGGVALLVLSAGCGRNELPTMV